MAGFRSKARPRAATPEERSDPRPNAVARLFRAVAVAAALLVPAAMAHASVALLLEQPYGGLGIVDPAGHSAIYLDHVCAATPIELRPCRPGELGVVISRYNDIAGRDWIAIPLVPYLYGVESAADIPQTMDRERETLLRDLYRRHALESVAPDLPDGSAPDGNWYELVGSAFDRTIFGFSVATTPDQDAALIARFNDRRNVERYNAAFRNCADFARTTINAIYPHAIRRNYVADFGLTSPKSVARALTHYASKHRDIDFHVFKIPQVAGSLPRSHGVQDLTEGLIKRYGVPLIVLSPVATGIVFVAYLGHGRFDMPRNAPVLDLRPAVLDMDTAATVETASQEPPADVPLPGASGANLRSVNAAGIPAGIPAGLSDTLVTNDGSAPVLDGPMLSPARSASNEFLELIPVSTDR